MTKRQNILRKCHVLHVPYRQLIPKRTTNTAYSQIITKIDLFSKSSVFRLFVNSLQVPHRNDVLHLYKYNGRSMPDGKFIITKYFNLSLSDVHPFKGNFKKNVKNMKY